MGELPVSMSALYDKLKRTGPEVLCGLMQGSARRGERTVKSIRHSECPPVTWLNMSSAAYEGI